MNFLNFRSLPSPLNPDEFSQLIAAQRRTIIQKFIDRVTIEVPGAAGRSRAYLEDHLGEVVDELCDFLDTRGSNKDYLQSAWLANKHGFQRAEGLRYSVTDLRHEYAILNQIILGQIPPSSGISAESHRLYSEIFQMSISQATESFLRNSASELLVHREEKRTAAENLMTSQNERDSARGERDIARGERDFAISAMDSSEELQHWLRQAINHIPKPLFFLNLETQKVWFSNEAARRMLGLSYEEEMDSATTNGRLAVLSPDGQTVALEQLPSRRALRGETIRGEEFTIQTLTGQYHIRIFAEQLPASFGQPASAIILFQDISILKETEKNLRKAQTELQEAVDIAQIGFWSLELPTLKLTATPIFLKQFGLEKETFAGNLQDGLDRIVTDDRARVSEAVDEAIKNRSPYHIEYRVQHPDGAIHWIEARGGTTYSPNGEPLRFTGTTIDITESVLTRQEMEASKKAAETANQTKSQFLANMSHEIRTPLGAIMGFASLLKDTSLGREQTEGFISVIERNSTQLLRIIDDILDLSKVEARMLLVEKIEFSLPELLTDFSSLMGFKARDKGVGFSSRAVTTLPRIVKSDPTRLRQILMNVVGNAIKFTDQGTVELRCCYKDGFLTFEIQDSGRGITPEQATHLFQPFSQADSTITRKYGGTGLGLVLTRSLAEALGGSFELKESVIGKGSIFIIRVQVEVQANAEYVTGLGFETVPPKTVTALGELADMQVLLVEDSPDNQALISIFLGRAGARTDIASDGAQGYKMALMKSYDMVLMDVQMPVMDGITAIKNLRQEGYGGIVIALTAHAMKEERQRCLQAGFDDFLSKPVSREDLVNLMLRHKKKMHGIH